MRIDLNSQKRKLLLFCPPDWLHSHDVQGVYCTVIFHTVLCNVPKAATFGFMGVVQHDRFNVALQNKLPSREKLKRTTKGESSLRHRVQFSLDLLTNLIHHQLSAIFEAAILVASGFVGNPLIRIFKGTFQDGGFWEQKSSYYSGS